MRWSYRKPVAGWEIWFAWYAVFYVHKDPLNPDPLAPLRVTHVWLEKVLRRKNSLGYWEYKAR